MSDFDLLRADESARTYGDVLLTHDSGRTEKAASLHDFFHLVTVEREAKTASRLTEQHKERA